MTTTHTTNTDTGPLDRFAERWRGQGVFNQPGKKEADLLRKMQIGHSIRCGLLYRFSMEHMADVRAGKDTCIKLAGLHLHGLLAIQNGQVHASEAGLELLAKYPLKR